MSTSILSPRRGVWANGNNNAENEAIFFPLTAFDLTLSWMQVRWQVLLESRSDTSSDSFRVRPAVRFANNPLTNASHIVELTTSTITAADAWQYGTDFVNVSGHGVSHNIARHVQGGLLVWRGTGSTLIYGRVQLGLDIRSV
jgi:hypothetical protein